MSQPHPDLGQLGPFLASMFGNLLRPQQQPRSRYQACHMTADDWRREWTHHVRLPGGITADDIEILAEEERLVIKASREVQNEDGSSDRIEATRFVQVPSEVNKETLVTKWLSPVSTLRISGHFKPQKPNCSGQDADREESASNLLFPFFGLLNLDPETAGLQVKTLLEDLKETSEDHKKKSAEGCTMGPEGKMAAGEAPLGQVLSDFLQGLASCGSEGASEKHCKGRPEKQGAESAQDEKCSEEAQVKPERANNGGARRKEPSVTPQRKQRDSSPPKSPKQEDDQDITKFIVDKPDGGEVGEKVYPDLSSFVVLQDEPRFHQVDVDVKGYSESDLHVERTVGNRVIVSGCHVDETSDGSAESRFKRSLLFPLGADLDRLSIKFNPVHQKLTLSAPML